MTAAVCSQWLQDAAGIPVRWFSELGDALWLLVVELLKL